MNELHLGFKAKTVVVGMLVFASAGFYFATQAGRAQHEIGKLREQNFILKAHLSSLEDSFDQIKTYSSSVKALAGAELTPSNIRDRDELGLSLKGNEQFGIFGSMVLTGAAVGGIPEITLPKSDTETFGDMLSSIDGMQRETSGVLRRLRALSTILRHHDSLIKFIPSLKPANGKITSEFGIRLSPFDGSRQMHAGIDISAAHGAPIKAPADGVVTFVGDFETLGNTVVIQHGASIMTRFGHASRANVKVGQSVQRGMTIGYVGNSGKSTGPHLHYEVWIKNEAVDPRDFFYDLTDRPSLITKDFRNSNRPMGGGSGY